MPPSLGTRRRRQVGAGDRMGGTGRGAGCSRALTWRCRRRPTRSRRGRSRFRGGRPSSSPLCSPIPPPLREPVNPSPPPAPHETGATRTRRASVSPASTHQHRGAAGGAGCRRRSRGKPPSAGLCCGWLSYAPGPGSSRRSPGARRRLCPPPPATAPGGADGAVRGFGGCCCVKRCAKIAGQKTRHAKHRAKTARERWCENPPCEKRAKNAAENIAVLKIPRKNKQCGQNTRQSRRAKPPRKTKRRKNPWESFVRNAPRQTHRAKRVAGQRP